MGVSYILPLGEEMGVEGNLAGNLEARYYPLSASCWVVTTSFCFW